MMEYVDMDIVISTWINICELKKAMDVCGCCYWTKKQRNLMEMFIGWWKYVGQQAQDIDNEQLFVDKYNIAVFDTQL